MEKITLAGCVIFKDNSILLLKRIEKDWYELPGGKIESGETPEEAATRELKEELLIDVEIVRKLGENDFEYNGKMLGYVWFLAEIKDNQIPKIGEAEEFSECKYIPIKDLPKHNLSTNMKNLITKIQLDKINS